MRVIFIIGLVLIVLGVASLIVPVPRRERHGFEAGPVSFGVETTTRRVVPRPVSIALIGGGVLLLVVGQFRRR